MYCPDPRCGRRSGPIGIDRVARRIPGCAYVFGSAKRCVRRKLPGLTGGQLHMRQSAAEFLERHAHFHAREAVADAVMAAPAEREMLTGIIAPDIKGIAVWELVLVAAAGAEREQQPRSGRKIDTPERDRLPGEATPLRDGWIEAQAFLDRVGDQAGVAAKRLPLRTIFE